SHSDHTMNILITLLVLGFALAGFGILEAYKATLWLVFLIVSSPVAVSFSDPVVRRELGEQSLLDMYKAGLKQIPLIGRLFAAQTHTPLPPAVGEQQEPQTGDGK